jgi:hypothetical protein
VTRCWPSGVTRGMERCAAWYCGQRLRQPATVCRAANWRQARSVAREMGWQRQRRSMPRALCCRRIRSGPSSRVVTAPSSAGTVRRLAITRRSSAGRTSRRRSLQLRSSRSCDWTSKQVTRTTRRSARGGCDKRPRNGNNAQRCWLFKVSRGRGIGPGPRRAGRHRGGVGGGSGHSHDPGHTIGLNGYLSV